jgi:hypothetical protein
MLQPKHRSNWKCAALTCAFHEGAEDQYLSCITILQLLCKDLYHVLECLVFRVSGLPVLECLSGLGSDKGFDNLLFCVAALQRNIKRELL